MADYDYKKLKDAYKKVGVVRNKVVLIKTDLRYLGCFEKTTQMDLLQAHFNALSELLDLDEGTLVVSTKSMSLCNTDIPFDLEKTPSQMGVLTEYIRKMKNTIRSFHPFVSYAAIGRDAKAITENVSRHAYGPETPEERLIDRNAVCVSVGIHPRFTCSTIHHVAMLMGVPYRYTKEYLHPVIHGGKKVYELFYQHVWYRECNIKINNQKNLFPIFEDNYELKTVSIGRGLVYSYSMSDFYECAIKVLKDNIYILLDKNPDVKPYRK